jgi:hypothetical protein
MTQAATKQTTAPDTTNDAAPPEGFEQAASDIVAYWEPASPGKGTGSKDAAKDPKFWTSEQHGFRPGSGPILFQPIDCVLSDSKLSTEDHPKASTLLFGKLLKPCVLKSAQEDEGYKSFDAGSMIGVWTKPGMKPLQKLSGAQVWMCNGQEVNGKRVFFKDIGKPSPMVQFDIRSKGEGKSLPVREDRRQRSLPPEVAERRAKVVEELGDIPF